MFRVAEPDRAVIHVTSRVIAMVLLVCFITALVTGTSQLIWILGFGTLGSWCVSVTNDNNPFRKGFYHG